MIHSLRRLNIANLNFTTSLNLPKPSPPSALISSTPLSRLSTSFVSAKPNTSKTANNHQNVLQTPLPPPGEYRRPPRQRLPRLLQHTPHRQAGCPPPAHRHLPRKRHPHHRRRSHACRRQHQGLSHPPCETEGPDILLRAFTPLGQPPETVNTWPVCFWFHGGGWVLGNIDTENVIATNLCNRARCVVIVVDYRQVFALSSYLPSVTMADERTTGSPPKTPFPPPSTTAGKLCCGL